jgi:MFS transporter, ACS family, glucarate transporter
MQSEPKVTNKNSQTGSLKNQGNYRWLLAFVFFVIGLIAYMDRANISIVAGPMMADLGLTKVQFGILGSMFTLGYAIMQIPGGMLAERFGSRIIITISLILWSVFTAFTGLATGFITLVIIRFLFGLGEGSLFPANTVFNTYWFTKKEKARAASALLAGTFLGPVIAPSLSVAIYSAIGWRGLFFIFGVIGIVIAIVWHLVSRDKPEQHPRVSEDEKALIVSNRTVIDAEKKKAPWGRFLKNTQFWAVGISFAALGYANALFMVWLPTYLLETNGFSLQSMGFAASMPWLAIFLVVLLGGKFSDTMLAKGKSRMAARGVPAIVGLVIFVLCIILASNTTNPWLNVAWLTIALGALGAPILASWAIANEKGGQYAGSLSGWMNTWGNVGGFSSPIIAGLIVQTMGWDIAMMSTIVPVGIAIVMWFFIKPDVTLDVDHTDNFPFDRKENNTIVDQ